MTMPKILWRVVGDVATESSGGEETWLYETSEQTLLPDLTRVFYAAGSSKAREWFQIESVERLGDVATAPHDPADVVSFVPAPARPITHTITRHWLHTYATNGAGWTAAQLAVFDIMWPPKAGWLSKLVGRTMTEQQRVAFEAEWKQQQVYIRANEAGDII